MEEEQERKEEKWGEPDCSSLCGGHRKDYATFFFFLLLFFSMGLFSLPPNAR